MQLCYQRVQKENLWDSFQFSLDFSAIWGPLIYAYVSASTGNPRLSLPVITSFFLIGALLLRKVDMDKRISEEEWAAS